MSIKLKATVPNLTAIPLLVPLLAGHVIAQTAPASHDHPSHFPGERQMEDDAKHFRQSRLSIEPDRTYSLAELVDFAERNNPETRVAWEGAKARGAALHIAQSELYPALAAVVLSQLHREDVLFNSSFVRQTVTSFGPPFQLDYTMFDFGSLACRIATARAELAAANFAFNDTHRKIIFQVAD